MSTLARDGDARTLTPAPGHVDRRTDDSGEPARGSRLRPEIQALRAIAVGLVVASHLWPKVVPGGFVGVDVFFAISGFLITSILLRETDSTGTLSLRTFWARRARRILPAALLTLGACAVATLVFVPVYYWEQFFNEMRASALYVQNWHLSATAVDYFASDQGPSPVQHFWSLSVEEQFYLVWPAMILLALRIGRNSAPHIARRRVVLLMGALTAASLGYSFYDTVANQAQAYFVTPTRAWEFGLGGLLAAATATKAAPARIGSILSWVGLGAIALAALSYSDKTPFPGHAALLPVLGCLAVIRAGTPAVGWAPTRALALRPVQYLGDISYSVYLWHWPLLILAPFVTHHEVGTFTKLAVVVLTLLAAAATKRVVEDPVRRSRLLGSARARWTFGLAAAGTAAVVALTAAGSSHVQAQIHKDAKITHRTLAAKPRCFGAAARDPEHPGCVNPALRLSVVPSPVEARNLGNAPCKVVEALGRVRACKFGVSPAYASANVALIGDSHASHWRAALRPVAFRKNWRGLSVTHTGCPFSKAVAALVEPFRTQCIEWNRDVLRWFGKHPEVSTVFVGEHTGGDVVTARGQSTMAAQEAGYLAAWNALPRTVKHIFVLRDTPKVHAWTLPCIEQSIASRQPIGRKCSVKRQEALDPDPAAMVAERVHSPRIHVIDLTRVLCDSRVCFPVIGGALVYRDYHHFNEVFAESLAPFVQREVERLTR